MIADNVGDITISVPYLDPESCHGLKLHDVIADEDDNVSFDVSQGAPLLEVVDNVTNSLSYVVSQTVNCIPYDVTTNHVIQLANTLELYFIHQPYAHQLSFPSNNSIQCHITRHFRDQSTPWFGGLLAIKHRLTAPDEYTDMPVDDFTLTALTVAL